LAGGAALRRRPRSPRASGLLTQGLLCPATRSDSVKAAAPRTIVILEIATLNVRAGMAREFEVAFTRAALIISAMPGYVSHQLQRGVEMPNRYVLLVNWQTLEAHTVGFRGAPEYQEWKALLHHFYDPFPTVEHYELLASNPA
jgi:heme-degrading monooxygenase HmoA